MNELDALQQWPAHNVAAGVVNGANTSTTGDVHRVFELASVTKPIVAYGVLVAVEEGVFDLDTPLGPAGSTVRHLLAHASGVGFASREPERAARNPASISSITCEKPSLIRWACATRTFTAQRGTVPPLPFMTCFFLSLRYYSPRFSTPRPLPMLPVFSFRSFPVLSLVMACLSPVRGAWALR